MKKFYITTSIAYINAAPHIGFALELVQADVTARYHRILGDEVFFLTGTDEHGSKAYQTAKELKTTPQALANKNSELFQRLTNILNISNDFFIRTSDKNVHYPGVELLWKKMVKAGDIYFGEYQGLYCVGCELFLTEKDLVASKCPIHKTKPEILSEKNYFFKLSKYSDKIYQIIAKNQLKILPLSRKNEILKILKAGLKDLSFSRSFAKLPWGIPVPGDSKQVIYVWGDALANYITGVGFGKDIKKFEKFWPADIHFIGKDILKFHAIYWPAMLLSAKLPLPETIFVHGFITAAGAKMSKSLGNIIDPFEIVKIAGVDPLRLYLLSQIPPTDDGDFTLENFKNVYTGLLTNGLGNLVARVASLAQKADLKLTAPKPETAAGQLFRKNKIGKFLLEEFKYNQAIELIWQKISETDKEINTHKPWELIGKNGRKEEIEKILDNLVDKIRQIASLLSPFLPATSVKIQKIFQGPKVSQFQSLFPRLGN